MGERCAHGVGLVISGQQNFFSAGQDIFVPSHLSVGFFFPQRGSVQVFVKMYLHLHFGFCSNGPDMELQSLKI